jgi:hypothetical protein
MGRFGDEGDEADIGAACWALEREVLAEAGEELGPRDSGGVVGTGRLQKGACIPFTLTPALSQRERGRGGVTDRERGHGGAEPVIRGEDAVVPVPVLAWRWDHVGEAVDEVGLRKNAR